MSDQGTSQPDDPWKVKDTGTTWGPSPGDALAPPPTPQAPEIPMSKSWPWVAGGAVAVYYLFLPFVALVILLVILGLVFHWF